MAQQLRGRRRAVWLVTALLCSVLTIAPAPAGAQVGDELPTPRNPDTAAQAGADAGPARSNQPPVPSLQAGEGSAPLAAAETLPQSGFATYRVFATQYQPPRPRAASRWRCPTSAPSSRP